MNWIQRLLPWKATDPKAAPQQRPMVGTLSGRPSYASIAGVNATIGREASFELLAQFYDNLAVLPRTTAILSGFVGLPEIAVKGNNLATDELRQWAQSVPLGYAGQGLDAWKQDLLAQALLFGFSVGEVQASAARDELERLWTYDSRSIGFETDAAGAVSIYQHGGFAVKKLLNPETTFHLAHLPRGCNPNGRSLFLSIPLVAQAWIDVMHAHRQTWLRNGIPIYWFNWTAPEGFNDPDGAKGGAISAAIEDAWNECMRSQVVDGRAKDIFTAGGGDTKLQIVGADGAVMDVAISSKTLMEQVVAATGIPPFMFGLQWSTTERMSKTQAETLTGTIDALRCLLEPSLRRVLQMRQQLRGVRGEIVLKWKDVSLAEEKDTAQAAAADAQAMATREKTGRALIQTGVFDQDRYAQYVLQQEEVEIANPMDDLSEIVNPPAPDPKPGEEADDDERGLWADSIKQETADAYDLRFFPGLKAHC